MAEAAVPYGRKTQRPPAIKDVHIMWMTTGLSCDGDSVSVTAAMQPSVEDVVLGAIPGLPKVHLHNPVLAYEVGDDFMKYWWQAAEGKLDPLLYPGGVGTVPTVQLFTDYLVRLMKYVEFMKKVVPLHDDLFDFMYQALPGYEKVGQRRILLGCWGSWNDPKVCDYTYRHVNEWGKAMFVTPSVIVDGQVVTNNLVDINLGIRILLGSSYYDDYIRIKQM
jgi:hypothetical protein